MQTRRAALTTLAASIFATASEPMIVRDLSGKQVTIETGKDVTVVTFISTQCPISNDYNDRMSAIYKDFASKGVKLFFVNANSTEPAPVVAEHSKSAGFPFPVYKDQNVAEKLNAQVTPEAFVFDRNGKLIYQGYVDDARNPARVQHNGLREAIDAALNGKSVANSHTKAFGCTIKRARRNS